jgi:NADPH-dependent 2,4-dienoyl-CoA reductase/sulfur reductase-like enzyme
LTPSATDLVIIGAGPAGLAAGVEATRRGLRTLLLDENPAPGGRIWQALDRGASDTDEAAGLTLIRAFASSGAEARYGAGVWAIEPDGLCSGARTASRIRYAHAGFYWRPERPNGRCQFPAGLGPA